MTTEATATSVSTSIEVNVAIDRAFRVFTEDMAGWWPPEHHILESELAEMVVEPRVGGRIYDRGVDGTECQWARVLVYEPPERFVFSWDINLDWKVETNPERSSEVEVRFFALDAGRTRVQLEHLHIERHGQGWERMRDAVGSPLGWAGGLDLFAAYAVR
jgi:uncharacterized protein YndB with AHSA1/START domain